MGGVLEEGEAVRIVVGGSEAVPRWNEPVEEERGSERRERAQDEEKERN